MSERPDGSQATVAGWLLVAVGIFAVAVSATTETFDGTVIGLAIANLGIGLGIILVSLGYLVRAIWFLPGREDEIAAAAETEKPRDMTKGEFADCEWCGLRVFSPNLACSNQADEDLKAELAAIDLDGIPDACKDQLFQKGYISN